MRPFIRCYPNLRNKEQEFIQFLDSYFFFGAPYPPPVAEAESLYVSDGRPVTEMYAMAANLALIIYDYEIEEGVFIEVFGLTINWLIQYRGALLAECIYPEMPRCQPLRFPGNPPPPCVYIDF